MSEKKHPPIHPGEILLEGFLKPMEVSQYRFGLSERFWLNLQARYDQEVVVSEGSSPCASSHQH